MKGLVLDQGLPRSAAYLLRTLGVYAVHVGELGMATSSDESILEYARREGMAIVTLDADFHTHIALSGASAPSVVRLRVQRLKAPGVSELIQSVLAEADADLEAGALVSVSKRLIRIKRLPIKGIQP